MMMYVIAYLVTAVVFCMLDFVWLTVLAKDFYRSQIGPLMLNEPNLIVAALFYVVYLFGILVFAIAPALREDNALMVIGLSALLGLVAYGTYDLSNLSTLKGWSQSLTIVDMIWGACVTSAAGTAGYYAARAFSKM